MFFFNVCIDWNGDVLHENDAKNDADQYWSIAQICM